MDTETAYNPRLQVPDFARYLGGSREAAERAYATLRVSRAVRYGDGPRQEIDFFPAARADAPVVVYFHGGYWRALDRTVGGGLAAMLVPHGIATALVGYDLLPGVKLSTVVAQARAAVSFIAAKGDRLGCDGSRLHLAGSSAGAHLVASVLSANLPARTALLISGLFDLRPVPPLPIGQELQLDKAEAEACSPQFQPCPVGTRTLIAVGDLESAAFIGQSRAYHAKLVEAGVDSTYLDLPGANHFSTGLSVPGSILGARYLDWLQPDLAR